MTIRERFRLYGVFFKDVGDPDWLEPRRLDDVARWSAAGFTLLTATLAFFGIKEGFLDRILRTDSTAALWVFVLVGLGVLCALLAGIFALKYLLYSAWLLAAVLFLAGVSLVLFPNVRAVGVPGASGLLTIALGTVLVVGLFVSVVWRLALPLTAAVLVLGVAATSFGLYGAAKIAVVSKTAPESPRLTAILEHQDDRSAVKVTVSGGQREGAPLVVAVRGFRASADTEGSGRTVALLGRAVLVSDAIGQVDDTVVFPLQSGDWSAIGIGYCEPQRPRAPEQPWYRALQGNAFGLKEDPPEPDVSRLCTDETDDAFDERVRLTLSEPDGPRMVVTFSTPETDPSGVRAAVSAAALPDGTAAHVRVVRQRAGQNETFWTSVMLPDDEGKAATTSAAVPVREGDVVTVSYRACAGSDACRAAWIRVASTRMLSP